MTIQESIFVTLKKPQLTSEFLDEFHKIKFINTFNQHFYKNTTSVYHLNLDPNFYEDLCFDILLFLYNYQESPHKLNTYFLYKHSRTLKLEKGKLSMKLKFKFFLMEAILNKITNLIVPGQNLPLKPITSANIPVKNEFSFLYAFHQKFIKDYDPKKDEIFDFFSEEHIAQENPGNLEEQILMMDDHYRSTVLLPTLNTVNIDLPTINWKGSELETIELIKSLIEAKIISANTEEDVFKFFEILFGLTLNKTQKLQTIKKRSKDQTPLLNLLVDRMERWATNDQENI